MQVSYPSDAHFRIFVIWDNFPFFLDRLLRDLLIFFPPPSPLPTSPPTWPYPPPGFNNQKKKGGWISWRGEGLSSKSGEGKGGGAQISERKKRGLDVDQLTPRTKSPKLTQNLILPPHPPHHGLVWEMKFDAGLNLNILFCIICPPDDADIAAI